MSRWFGSKAKDPVEIVAADEDQHLQRVEQALLHLLNDDIAEADRILGQHDSSFHHVGRGISSFIASMLAAEKELLKEAAVVLQLAEAKSWEDMKKAQSSPTSFKSQIYPPGTEYLLCYTVSQLTSAICAVLGGGSIPSAISGFYKLRKAFLTLDGIMDIESKYLQRRTGSKQSSTSSPKVSLGNFPRQGVVNTPEGSSHGTSDSELEATNEKTSIDIAGAMNGSAEPRVSDLERDVENMSLPAPTRVESKFLDVDPASVGITSHTDIFIHSGTRLCYGILLLVFSMIETPIFNKILYIVGFKGDREGGTLSLWEAARFNNFNSAISGIILLGYYNGIVGFCDILPTDAGADSDIRGYPKETCRVLLTDMRKRYPDSRLWKLEESRMYSYNRNLDAALKILQDNSTSNMKQIAVLNIFEMSLTTMFIHDYELCAKTWIQCSELSNWSPALYAYMTGCAFIEIYRNLRTSDPKAAAPWKEKATEYIRKAPPVAGKQKIMSKKLPFDLYIIRKVQKWEERAKAWKVDLVDAIGVSPMAEMMYQWGGGKKQDASQLQKTLDLSKWDRVTHADKLEDDLDEQAIWAMINASMLRNLGKYDEARELLTTKILNHDKHEFNGHLKDNWTPAAAHYEMACIAWNEKDLEGADHGAKVNECQQWLEKCQQWGDHYILDSRMSVRVTTASQTVKRHRKIMDL